MARVAPEKLLHHSLPYVFMVIFRGEEMTAKLDIVGKKFGKLKVIEFAGCVKQKSTWKCLCDCGNLTTRSAISLKNSSSCGCMIGKTNITHNESYRSGKGSSKEYSMWNSMMNRCSNPKNKSYARYGGRGIKVCNDWHTYENFLKDMGRCPSDEYSLDRIDNSKGYSKENCRWATAKDQARNRRSTVYATAFNQTKAVAEWAEIYGMKYHTLRRRILVGMSVEDALTKPVQNILKRARPIVSKTERQSSAGQMLPA
jgi:hypothetical protein